MFGSSNSVNGSVVSMTVRAHNTIRKISISPAQSPRAFTAHRHTMSTLLDVLLVLERALAVALCRHCFVRSFVRVLDQILPIEGRLGGGNKYGERGSCGRDGRKGGSRGGVGTYKRTSVLLSYEQRADLSRALERRKRKIRALHMLTPKGEASMRRQTCAVSISLHPAR